MSVTLQKGNDSDVTESNDSNGLLTSFVIAIAVCVVCMVTLTLTYMHKTTKQQLEREKLAVCVQNPLLIAVCIGDYDENPESSEIDGFLPDLTNIDIDIKNIVRCYVESLNYEIYPTSNRNNSIKTYWTETEIMKLFKTKAKYLNDHIQDYDGLIVFLSCHGYKDYVVTSDYKKISKNAIHRLFSANYSSIRNIPRLFVYDCCHGLNDRNKSSRQSIIENKISHSTQYELVKGDVGKPLEVEDVAIDDTAALWCRDEPNPDYQLIVINSTNYGFQSKMTITKGSYLIAKLMERITQNINNGNKLFLFEIMDEIQQELHDKGKQLIETKYFNKTQYLKFMVNHQLQTNCADETENEQKDEMLIEQANEKYIQLVQLQQNDNNEEMQDELI
eukprot:394594_1